MIPNYIVPRVPQPKPPARTGLTTPEPVYSSDVTPITRPAKFEATDRLKAMAAAHVVRKLYPGPAGEVLHAEILAWNECGWWGDPRSPVARLVAQLAEQQ